MNSEEQTKTIDQFDKASVLVIGDLMLDRYLNGTMSRISPEAPAPLIDITSDSFRLGGAANAINNICALGGNVFAVGVVGDDWFGKRLIGLLKQEKVDTSCVIEIKERPTTIKTRVIAGGNYVSLFIGRLDDIGHDGMQIVRDMVTIFNIYHFKTEIIVASVRHPLHVIEAAKVGAHVATIPFNVIEKMFSHPLTDAGLEKFLSDWKKVPK